MSAGTVLIAAELRDLLPEEPVPGYDIEWLPADAPVPAGDRYVAIIPLLSRWMGGQQIKGLPNLKVIANCAVGVDNVDLVACQIGRILVTNTPGVLTQSTADLTVALILMAARRTKEGERLVADGTWAGWHPTQLLGLELDGATLGIVGCGRIGRAVGRRATAFGMRLLYTARSRKTDFEAETGAVRTDLGKLLAGSDVVTLHVPSTPETRGFINRERFAQMQPGAILVNTARGDVVRESALLEALEQGHLGAAGLDVFAEEPTVPAALVTHPRVVCLPHLGSATTKTRRAMAGLAAQNVRAVLGGGTPLSPVF